MADSEFLRSIDARVARTNEILEEDRLERERERAGHAQSLEDIRFELRQQSLRAERIVRGHLRRLEEMSEESREHTSAIRELSAEIRDQAAQIRANTRGLLTLLDERGGGPSAAGA